MISAYIVPGALLEATPPKGAREWHATVIPADLTQRLLVVDWSNPNEEISFESLPGVLPLGDRWDPVSPEVSNLLSSMEITVTAAERSSLPVTDLPAAADTVGATLKRLAWPCARMVR